MIADVLEQAGVIIKVRNLFPRENKLKEYHLDTDYNEIDIAIVQNNDTPKKRFYLFECKADAKINIHEKAWSILTGNVDRRIMDVWPDSEIVKKTIVHPADDDILNSDLGEKIFVVNVNKDLFKYYE